MNPKNRDRENGRILVVDDDGMFRESLVQNLSDAGFAPAQRDTLYRSYALK